MVGAEIASPFSPMPDYGVNRFTDAHREDTLMNASERFAAWQRARMHLIVSQIAPTALLITTIGLLQFGLSDTSLATRVATLGILLASGILGALVQFQSATEAERIGRDLIGGEYADTVADSVGWLWVPKFLTPAVFVVIYIALVWAILF